MSILIVGGCGFLGSNVAREFAKDGNTVICCSRTPRKIDFLIECAGNVKIEKGDVTDLPRLLELVKLYDVKGIINCSIMRDEQLYPSLALRVHVKGMGNVLDAARQADLRVISISTGTVYGPREDLNPIKEDDPMKCRGTRLPGPVPRTPVYCTLKKMVEMLTLMYHDVYDLDAVVLRMSHIYGPNQTEWNTVISFIESGLAGRRLELQSGGDMKFDFTYVKDAAHGISLAYNVRPIKHRIFNISSGRLYSLYDLSDAVKRAIPGAQIEIGPGLWEEMYKNAWNRGPFDLTRAHDELGYAPQYDLNSGVKELTEWLHRNPNYIIPAPPKIFDSYRVDATSPSGPGQ